MDEGCGDSMDNDCDDMTDESCVAGTRATFVYTGDVQSFVVPAGVTSLTAKIWGAGGGGDLHHPGV